MTLKSFLGLHYSNPTVAAYERNINEYRNNVPHARHATYKDIVDYIALVRKRYTNTGTVNGKLSAIKAYYRYLFNEGIRTDNPAQSIVLKDKQSQYAQLQDLFTPQELESLLDRPSQTLNLGHRDKVLMSFLIYQGLHVSELERLNIWDISLHHATITIAASTKHNGRELTLKPTQILLIHQYLNEVRPKLLQGRYSDAFLLSSHGSRWLGEDIGKLVSSHYKNKFTGRKVTALTIRQSVITNLLKKGHDTSVVQAFVGHKTAVSIEKYRQTDVETLQAAVNKYHPLR